MNPNSLTSMYIFMSTLNQIHCSLCGITSWPNNTPCENYVNMPTYMVTNSPIKKWKNHSVMCLITNIINIENIYVRIQRCIMNSKIYKKRLLPSFCAQSLCLAYPLQHAGNNQMHHIYLWLGQQPNYLGMSLAYFLLNDRDKAHFYDSTIWILSRHCPISSCYVRTMQPTIISLSNCK